MLRTVSPRWFTETTRAQRHVHDLATRIRVPLLVFYGDQDEVADHAVSQKWYERYSGADKTLRILASTRHEALHDVTAAQITQETTQWILQRSS